jgi:hypothetical protein
VGLNVTTLFTAVSANITSESGLTTPFLNVTNSSLGIITPFLNVTGQLHCAMKMADSCFGLVNACPAFDPCLLNMTSTNTSSILVQTAPGSPYVVLTTTLLKMHSNSSTNGVKVVFGDSSVSLDKIQEFITYAEVVKMVATDWFELRGDDDASVLIHSTSQSVNIQAQTSIEMIALDTVTIQSVSEYVQLRSPSTAITLGQPSAYINITSLSFGGMVVIDSPDWIFQYSTDPFIWMSSNSTFRYNTLPGATTTGTVVGSESATIRVYADIVLQEGATIIAQDSQGLVPMSGIKSGRDNLGAFRIQNSTNFTTVDIRSTIVNNDINATTSIGYPITFLDTDGANFWGTPIYNGNTGPGNYLECNDTEGFKITNAGCDAGLWLGATIQFVEILPNTLYIKATAGIETDVALLAPASPCPSDERVKHNIKNVSADDDLQYILNLPRRVSYEFKPSMITFEPNKTRQGYIAQELEKFDSTLIHKRPKKFADGTVLPDFMSVHMNELIPRLAGAIEALYQRNLMLEKQVAELMLKKGGV